MVKQFTIKIRNPDGSRIDGRKLTKQIRDRVDICYEPVCWILKDPKDKGSIYVSKKFLGSNQKQRRLQIRDILFQLAYEEVLPLGRLTRMRCSARCINPSHIKVAGGWKPSYEAVDKMLEYKWLTSEQAKEWFGWSGKATKPETEEPESPTEEDRKNAQKARQFLEQLA